MDCAVNSKRSKRVETRTLENKDNLTLTAQVQGHDDEWLNYGHLDVGPNSMVDVLNDVAKTVHEFNQVGILEVERLSIKPKSAEFMNHPWLPTSVRCMEAGVKAQEQFQRGDIEQGVVWLYSHVNLKHAVYGSEPSMLVAFEESRKSKAREATRDQAELKRRVGQIVVDSLVQTIIEKLESAGKGLPGLTNLNGYLQSLKEHKEKVLAYGYIPSKNSGLSKCTKKALKKLCVELQNKGIRLDEFFDPLGPWSNEVPSDVEEAIKTNFP